MANTINAGVTAGCDGNYAGVCVPDNQADVDCLGSGDGPAWVEGPLFVTGWDHYGLDTDGDRVACRPPDPTVSLTAPTNGATVSGSQVVSAVAANARGVQFTLDGVNLGPEDTTAPFTTTWVTTTTPNGGHTLGAVARNAAGSTATAATVSVTVANDSGPPPSNTQPILLITKGSSPFSTYYEEILEAEGLNSYVTKSVSSVDLDTLNGFDVAILADMSLTDGQAAMFTNWVGSGGDLIAMRPDTKLAGLMGLSAAGSTLSDTYLRIDSSSGPGTGLVSETIQFHGTADRYTLNGATALATLYSNANQATSSPAVTTRSVGSNGGTASAYTFDLARSVVLTRQGNPDWAGRNVDGVDGIQATEMFFGANGDPDWNNLDKALIPIADEQQRLLANIITAVASDRKPIPRFWYFPREEKAVIVMTGDDHGTGGTKPRFDAHLSKSPPGCNVANWECVRSSSYISPYVNPLFPQLTNAEAVAYQAQGFDLGVHFSTECAPWGTEQNLRDVYTLQSAGGRALWPGMLPQVSTRTHCVEWDDWATHARVKADNGIRFDTDYYFYPASWTQGRPGYFNGTGMPMRYADLDGSVIDVYQSATSVSDESGHDVPAAVSQMLDNALGANGYYAAVTANIHTDSTCGACIGQTDGTIAAAQARGVPVVSGRQMLDWLDARNSSSYESIRWSGGSLSFAITGGANGLTGMLPIGSPSGNLTSISRNGSNVAFSVTTIKGVRYALFSAATGSYSARYGA